MVVPLDAFVPYILTYSKIMNTCDRHSSRDEPFFFRTWENALWVERKGREPSTTPESACSTEPVHRNIMQLIPCRKHSGNTPGCMLQRWPSHHVESHMKHYWKCLGTNTVFENRILALRQDTYHFLPNDIIKDFTVLEFGDWVNIIPITSQGEVVLIRQYRHGIMRDTIEIPGGLLSETDTSPIDAALRELEEETGYSSSDIIHIGTVEPNPAIQNNRCYTYLARNAYRKSSQRLDSTEAIHVDVIKKEEVYGMIRSGQITHGLVIAAFAHLLLHEQSP